MMIQKLNHFAERQPTQHCKSNMVKSMSMYREQDKVTQESPKGHGKFVHAGLIGFHWLELSASKAGTFKLVRYRPSERILKTREKRESMLRKWKYATESVMLSHRKWPQNRTRTRVMGHQYESTLKYGIVGVWYLVPRC